MSIQYRWYQYDAAKMVNLMEIDRLTDYDGALGMIDSLLQEITDVKNALQGERKANDSHSVLESRELVPKAKRIYGRSMDGSKVFWGGGVEGCREYQRLAQAKYRLCRAGYVIRTGEMTAYYKPTTDRHLEQKYGRVYGFAFEEYEKIKVTANE